jgi:hypothetical protein
MRPGIEPLRALARDLYVNSSLTLADVAEALRLTRRRVNRWSSRDGCWSSARVHAQRDRWKRGLRVPPVDASKVARRALAALQRGGYSREDAARALLAHAAALVLEAAAAQAADAKPSPEAA